MTDTPQFIIGQIVSPIIDTITPSGEVLPTAGMSGTVVYQQLRFIDYTKDLVFYNHQVELFEYVYVTSGLETPIAANLFWYTDGNLGGIDPYSDIVKIDIPVESEKFNVGQQKVNSALGNIQSIADSISTLSPYYDIIKSNLDIIQQHVESMDGYNSTYVEMDSAERDGKSAGKQGEHLGLDADIFSELSENALGYYDVMALIDAELVKIRNQIDQQQAAAQEDNEANFNLYYEQYVMGGGDENLLVPGGQTAESDPPAISEQNTTLELDLTTLSGLLNQISFPTSSN